MYQKFFSAKSLIALALLLLAFMPATTVFAAQPDIQTFHDEGSFVAADCGSFLALEDFVQDVRVIVFSDDAGTPVKAESHINWNGVLTNSVTGKTLRDPGHSVIIGDLQTGTSKYVGLVFGITVPGEGIAVLDAGKVIFDADGNVIFEGGPHQFLDEGPALICAALD